ncbi:conjugal transfer protein TraA [Vibrio parahaemolyticus]|uniref:conjugal transfer protein TraA n=1 Tax=Vibrio parahaemolyticus TaxID=670 RepID=UPI00112264C1|nr:conjugal transfer protein TraA [Vibrio parahaemolyticus]EJG1669621.1 conjugal transfer protein TraA [Vibrio parahaemolyticus]EJG1777635.1 conjugal transfer protein TraA [Vibrio parahaemolyticus]TOJ18244.1 conjugal transfer protein TraA [Vibrio parahaemolyticus]TOJ52023.1 conjugal transfer protein TraA [Vibrio parahaemolyticus]
MPLNKINPIQSSYVYSGKCHEEQAAIPVRNISHKTIEKAVLKTVKLIKKGVSKDNDEKYGVLKNHISYVCNSEINRILTEKSGTISNGKLIGIKQKSINQQVLMGTKLDYLMCSAPLQNYLTSLLDRDPTFKKLNKDDRQALLSQAYEMLDGKIDEKIITKKLKMPTIAASKELVAVICETEFSKVESDSKMKKRLSEELSKELNIELNFGDFCGETLNEIEPIFSKYL